jgi:hypothetical protein
VLADKLVVALQVVLLPQQDAQQAVAEESVVH